MELPSPTELASVPQAELPGLLAHLAALQAAIAARLASPETRVSGGNGLTVKEAAKRLGVSPEYIYKHKDRLPFVRRHGRRVVCMDTGIDRWQKTRR